MIKVNETNIEYPIQIKMIDFGLDDLKNKEPKTKEPKKHMMKTKEGLAEI